jgi:hypothetical protein
MSEEIIHTPQEVKKFLEVKLIVEAKLLKFGIPIEKWGIGAAKTIDHLVTEVLEGEIDLVEDEEGGLLRKIEPMGVNVYYHDESGDYRLFEDYAVFKDGRVRRRQLETSIGEKMKPGETTKQAAARAIAEELSIPDGVIFENWKDKEDIRESNSYPGLMSKYNIHEVDAEIPKEHFKSEGYIERQKDKDIFYKWKKIELK